MNITKAVIFDGIDQVRIGNVTLAECGPTQIIAETIYTFTSPGTELRVLGGFYGAADNACRLYCCTKKQKDNL